MRVVPLTALAVVLLTVAATALPPPGYYPPPPEDYTDAPPPPPPVTYAPPPTSAPTWAPPTTTYAPPTWAPPTTTYAPPTWAPPTTTYAPPTWAPPTTTYAPPTWAPPTTTYAPPTTTYAPPTTTYAPPTTTYAPPTTTYAPPTTTYAPPTTTYAPPTTTYAPPTTTYAPPTTTYAPPTTTYAPPTTTYAPPTDVPTSPTGPTPAPVTASTPPPPPPPPTTTYAPPTTTYAPPAPTNAPYTPAPYTPPPPPPTTTYPPQYGTCSYLIEHKHRQLYYGEVNATADGWIHYCPGGHDWWSGSYLEPTCVSFRLWDLYEADHWGNVAWVDCDDPPVHREIKEPYLWQLIGKPRNASLPLCPYADDPYHVYDAATWPTHVCGQTEHGAPLWYGALPVTYELWSIATGYLHVDAVVFLARGWYVYDGRNYSVYPGTVKFDISVFGYYFAWDGASLRFDIQVKYPQGTTTIGDLTNVEKDLLATENSRVVTSPRYAVSNGTLALSSKWRNATVTVHEPQVADAPDLVIRYNFSGPFKHLAYDAVLWAEEE